MTDSREPAASHDAIIHCEKCKTFTKHVFDGQRVVTHLTVEDLYRCIPCGTTRRFGLSVMFS